MALPQVLLDTDILSAILRQNQLVIPKARAYLAEHGRFTLSILTRYEILHGLKTKGANQQAIVFDRCCNCPRNYTSEFHSRPSGMEAKRTEGETLSQYSGLTPILELEYKREESGLEVQNVDIKMQNKGRHAKNSV